MPPAPRRLLTLAALVPALACNGRGDGTGSTSGATTSGATSATSSSTTLDTSSGSGQTSAATSTGATESTGQATASTTDTTAGVKFDLPVPDGGGVDTDTDTGDVDESTCEAAAMSLTSAGCLFAPIVTNTLPQNLPWAVIAANTGDAPATATLHDDDGAVIAMATIAPGELHVFELSAGQVDSLGVELPATSGRTHQALLLESDRPIVAYQFFPYSSSQIALADAAMLLPAHAWGDNYLALMSANPGEGDKWITVVSLDDQNEVKVYVPAAATGSILAGGEVPTIGPGQDAALTLGKQDTLRLYAGANGDPISGTAIYSSKPVAVYVGSPGMSLPGPGFQSFRDSLEEQIPPRSAWGTDYTAIKFQPRSSEADLYRIIADKDGTVVTLTGDYQAQYDLDEGEFVEFATPASFYASGNQAFLIAHFLTSCSNNAGPKDEALFPGPYMASNNCGASTMSEDLGDPALTFLPPDAQWRSRYTFLTPATFAWDMITVIGTADGWGTITLDGQPLPAPTPLAGGDKVFARVRVDDGPHFIQSPSHKFGLEVYGYDCRISYAYPGGLQLGSINIPPPPPN
ncbi:MAG TPA: IgGFc-binding protein [Nannocystaceae bacterium]|nr:IgGFc-binding protein [Nannocystaceae bacterium]